LEQVEEPEQGDAQGVAFLDHHRGLIAHDEMSLRVTQDLEKEQLGSFRHGVIDPSGSVRRRPPSRSRIPQLVMAFIEKRRKP
jgi:hypothetical protein